MLGKTYQNEQKKRKKLKETGTTAGIASTLMTKACLCNRLPKAWETEGREQLCKMHKNTLTKLI